MSKLGLVEPLLTADHRRVTTRAFRENLAEALSYTSKNKGSIVLTKNGEERGVLVSVEDAWLLDAIKGMIEDECDYIRNPNRGALFDVIRERLLAGDDGGKVVNSRRKRNRA